MTNSNENYWTETEKDIRDAKPTRYIRAMYIKGRKIQFLADKAQHENEISALKQENERLDKQNLHLCEMSAERWEKIVKLNKEISDLKQTIEELKKRMKIYI